VEDALADSIIDFICWYLLFVAGGFNPVGANLVGIADYARTLPFVDLVKQSRNPQILLG
jgi:hypothetical protein